MQSIKSYFQKLLSFLRIRAIAAGLEVSDQVLRFAYSDRGGWKTESVRLAPGVLEKGVIKDATAFAAALQELKITSAVRGKKEEDECRCVFELGQYVQSGFYVTPHGRGRP